MLKRIPLFITLMISLFSCSNEEETQSLFNEKDLSGWDTYIGPGYDTTLKKRDTIPLGLNNDPLNVFSVVQVDGRAAIRISGEQFGGISTKNEYQNYHLSVEFKWGKQKWAPRKNEKRDSGILYHAVEPHGADGGFWMRSQEFQVQEGDCGDYWGVAGGTFDIPATEIDSGVWQYDPKGMLLEFSSRAPRGRRCIKNPDVEKPNGEWNVIDIYCLGDTSIHMINGTVNMVLYNSRQLSDGQELPLTRGKIQIQSEGAEVFYRNIVLQGIDKLPEAVLQKN
jgi:hypothetical protein